VISKKLLFNECIFLMSADRVRNWDGEETNLWNYSTTNRAKPQDTQRNLFFFPLNFTTPPIISAFNTKWGNPPFRGDGHWGKKEKNKNYSRYSLLLLSPRPGPDGPNASGWYRQLREPISPSSLLNCDQLWQAIFSWVNNSAFSCYLRTRF